MPSELALVSNHELLEQAITNVVRNSVKYTEQGTIKLVAAPLDGRVLVAVVDTGVGIPEDALPRVAERFYRAEASRDGFGLGLAIVQAAMRGPGRRAGHRFQGRLGDDGHDEPAHSRAEGDALTKLLVVDDEPALRESLGYALRQEGFEVEVREDGSSGLEAALSDGYDLVILDLTLPGLPGTEVCRRLRAESAVPIVMLTARGAEIDRVLGLEIGADDYVTKPFSIAELVGRVRAILRRQELDRKGVGTIRRVGGLELDPVRHQVRVDGQLVSLTPSEFRLLDLLASDPERVFSRKELMQHLWDSSYVGDQRACDIHVSNLRGKLEPDSHESQADPHRARRRVQARRCVSESVPNTGGNAEPPVSTLGACQSSASRSAPRSSRRAPTSSP